VEDADNDHENEMEVNAPAKKPKKQTGLKRYCKSLMNNMWDSKKNTI
jgi:hypothetical protein